MPPLTLAFSLNVWLHAKPPQISKQKLDEEVGLLGVGHPQYAAAVPCDGVVPTGGESVSNMQRLRANRNPSHAGMVVGSLKNPRHFKMLTLRIGNQDARKVMGPASHIIPAKRDALSHTSEGV